MSLLSSVSLAAALAVVSAALTDSGAAALSATETIVCEDHHGQGGGFRYLQPDNMDLILHGAGQSPGAFRAYWEFMPNATKPMVYMSYTGLNASSQAHVQSYFADLEEECASYGK